MLFLDEIKKILEFLPNGDYCNIFNGKFARCLLGLDIDSKTGELNHFGQWVIPMDEGVS